MNKSELLNDLLITIQNAEMYFDDNAGRDCCGQACNCYDNNKSDLKEAYAELNELGLTYDDLVNM